MTQLPAIIQRIVLMIRIIEAILLAHKMQHLGNNGGKQILLKVIWQELLISYLDKIMDMNMPKV